MRHEGGNLIYALSNGTLVSVEDVPAGLKCDCFCPACGEQLVAKKGQKMIHHFAHRAGTNCAFGYQTSLHLLAKEILAHARRMVVPELYLRPDKPWLRDHLISPAREIFIDDVAVEQNYGSIIPDVAVYADGKKFFVEIYVTHAVDAEKLAKLEQAGISTIEIDLSKTDRYIQAADLSEVLLGNSENKKWIFNTQVDKYYQAFLQVSEKRLIFSKGRVDYTDFCPRKLHWVNGKPCASQLDDCFNCDYQFEVGDDYVLCMGRSLVTSIDDLKKPRKERRPCRTSPVNFKTMADAKLWICPDCGYPLRRVEGKNGAFIGCSNYPWCNFTMPDNNK